MAQDLNKKVLNVANKISSNMGTTALKYREKTDCDKSFAVTILGVNQKFTGNVSAEDQTTLITKYSIPATIEEGDPKYYTIKINGAYYIVKQNASFMLYDKVMAYLPNGDWSRMYLDYQSGGKGETVSLPHNFISTEEPEEGMLEGDYWYQVDENNAIQAKWQYLPDDETGELQWWLMFDVISGVGEDIGNHSERFNDYTDNEQTARDSWLHIEGKNNKALGGNAGGNYCTHMDGEGNRITNCKWSDIHGNMNTVSNYAYYVTLSGSENEIVSGSWLTVSGYDNKITNSNGSTVGGQHNTLNGADSSIVAGEYNTVSGDYDVVVGYNNTVSANYSGVFGQFITIGGAWNLAVGLSITVSYATYSIIAGRDHNISNASEALICGSYANVSSSDRIVVGAGSSNNPANCFRVDDLGNVYATQYNTSGADYAEYMEWYIRNFAKQDRRGMLVSLRGDKITPAQGADVIGIISSRPSVVGNAYEEHWHGKYKTDVFGDYILDENGERQLSEDYDPEKIYIPRSKRPEEWAVVGLVGRLVVCDNGYCEPGKPILALDGIAVPALRIQGESTPYIKNITVLKRIDKNHIEVIIK